MSAMGSEERVAAPHIRAASKKDMANARSALFSEGTNNLARDVLSLS